MPPRQAETSLQGVQPVPSRQGEEQLRGVQSLSSREDETQLCGVQPCPHGRLKGDSSLCKTEREAPPSSKRIKREPESSPEIKQEPGPFTIHGYFGIGEENKR
ncbi:hypothetical protein N8152_00465 [bacterium]|nr:hypothetical protein [bacterium]